MDCYKLRTEWTITLTHAVIATWAVIPPELPLKFWGDKGTNCSLTDTIAHLMLQLEIFHNPPSSWPLSRESCPLRPLILIPCQLLINSSYFSVAFTLTSVRSFQRRTTATAWREWDRWLIVNDFQCWTFDSCFKLAFRLDNTPWYQLSCTKVRSDVRPQQKTACTCTPTRLSSTQTECPEKC